jgi:hypothetical protein
VGSLPTPDLGAGQLHCSEILTCAGNCTDQTCVNACITSGAPNSQRLYAAFLSCFTNACRTPCNPDPNATACTDCVSNTTITNGTCTAGQPGCGFTGNGQCATQYTTCMNDV